jgi:serine/threonine protein kinase
MNDVTTPCFTSGQLLAGKYRVERVLGEGGMGVVLAAKHEGLNTDVAIKLLRENAMGQTDVLGRFLREARAAVSLKSEHVARVFDVGNLEDGRPYIVMERLVGRDFGEVIEQEPAMPVPQAIDYVLQACEAIAEAHSMGIVHRDLKPKNLFLTHAAHGRPLVKVLDFGISKIDTTLAPNEMQLTRTTEVIGSPSYMSPEQLRSARNVDARTDIWALGVILYELLTKRVPFCAETVTELVLVVVTEREPSVRSMRPDVPEGLEQIIGRCLAKLPEHRFQSVLELVQALEPYASGPAFATATERVRALSKATAPLAMTPAPTPRPSAQPVVPAASSSSRVNVHGGTSVAWGETQSHGGPNAHVPPQRGRTGLFVAIGLATFFVCGSIGTAAWWVKTHSAHAQVTPPPVESAMPLPPGRKDLPPEPPPPATVPDPPAASTLPETRKPPPPASVTPKPNPPVPLKTVKTDQAPPSRDKPDDLSNIGRR